MKYLKAILLGAALMFSTQLMSEETMDLPPSVLVYWAPDYSFYWLYNSNQWNAIQCFLLYDNGYEQPFYLWPMYRSALIPAGLDVRCKVLN